MLHLVRKFLQAETKRKGLVSTKIKEMPQGATLSPVVSNIYLGKLNKEIGLRFVRFADDINIKVK